MKNTENNIQKTLDNFINQLKQLEATCSESEFDDYLINEVAPKLIKEDQLWGTSVFRKLDIAVELHKPASEQMIYSIEGAMKKMNNHAICWFLDHIYKVDKAIKILDGKKQVGTRDLESSINGLKRDKEYLQESLNGDLYERIQLFRNDVKKLQPA